MLINSDFERHNFYFKGGDQYSKHYKLCDENEKVLLAPKTMLAVAKSKKGVHNVKLYRDDELVSWEAMWSPEQLRIFLLFHKVITDNQKL